MIFKTYENDLDGITNKLGFSKRSFAEWGSQVAKSFKESEGFVNKFTNSLKTMFTVQHKNSDNWLRNKLGDIVSSENIDTFIPQLTKSRTEELVEQIVEVDRAKGSWQGFFDTLNDGEKYVIDLIKNTNDLSKLTGDDLVKANKQARQSAIAHNTALKQQTFQAKATEAAFKALAIAGNMLLMYGITIATLESTIEELKKSADEDNTNGGISTDDILNAVMEGVSEV